MYLNTNGIVMDQQSGFRKRRQTKDNLTFLIQKSFESNRNGKSVVAIFFDIQSAFDKVWHLGLLNKLVKLRVPYYLVRTYYLVRIIREFLRDRTFVVKVNGEFSLVRKIGASVPQGGVLSPTLFAVYINDSPSRKIKNKRYTLLFADDLAYFEIYKKKNTMLENRVNKFLSELAMWPAKWRLTLAMHKCVYTTFTRKHAIDEFNLKLNNEILPYDENPKFLGIHFDSKLNFNKHIEYILEKCNERIGVIKALSFGCFKLPFHILRALYKSLIRSLMEYSSMISTLISDKQMKKLQTIQN